MKNTYKIADRVAAKIEQGMDFADAAYAVFIDVRKEQPSAGWTYEDVVDAYDSAE